MSSESSKLSYKRRRLSGYNIWHREVLQSSDPSATLSEINKVSGEKWQALSQEEREAYNRRAEEEVSSSARPVELKQILNQLAKLSNSIKENLGAEFFFTLVKGNDHYCGGTEKGLTFLQSEAAWVPYSFIGYICKPVPVRENAQIQSTSRSIDQLRREVEQIFNQRYGQVSGDGKKLPYSKLATLGIIAYGLPDGVPGLKRPSAYGRRQLQSIVDNKDRLKFNG